MQVIHVDLRISIDKHIVYFLLRNHWLSLWQFSTGEVLQTSPQLINFSIVTIKSLLVCSKSKNINRRQIRGADL